VNCFPQQSAIQKANSERVCPCCRRCNAAAAAAAAEDAAAAFAKQNQPAPTISHYQMSSASLLPSILASKCDATLKSAAAKARLPPAEVQHATTPQQQQTTNPQTTSNQNSLPNRNAQPPPSLPPQLNIRARRQLDGHFSKVSPLQCKLYEPLNPSNCNRKHLTFH
jgi:hypothetical protein